MILTPYDFSAVTGSKLGGERTEDDDSISLVEVKSYLGVNPPRVSGKYLSLMCLYSNIDKCKLWQLAPRCLCFFSLGPSCVLTWGLR